MNEEKPYLKIECILDKGLLKRTVNISDFTVNEAIGIIEGIKWDIIKRNEEKGSEV
jgi:hypothetical protein